MKEDYLWDKTGGDAEIEQLENALQAFRYREMPAPPLPTKILPFKKELPPPRRIFQFKFAAAACVAFVVVLSAVLFQLSNNRAEYKQEAARTVQPQIDSSIISPVTAEESRTANLKDREKSGLENIKNAKRNPARNEVEAPRVIPVNFRPQPSKIKNIKPLAKPEIRLTNEEKYAYDQLMTALSVTSSKLKLVKDKVEGTEEKSNTVKGMR